jgi:hypothetical protein
MATSANRPRRIYIDSDNRVSGTHNDFEVELPAAVVGATSGEPISATIPLACYPVPSYERYLWWTSWDPMVGGATLRTTVNVDQNFTTIQQLLDAVNFAVINNTIRTDNGTTIAGGLAFTYNNTTKKVEFSSVGNITLYGYMASPEYYHNLTYRLGFTNPYNTGVYSTSAGYVSANPGEYAFPSILRTSCIYIACSLCQGDAMTTSETGNRDLLVKVPVATADSALGSIIQYQNNMKDRTISSMPHTFKRIRVRLLDEEQMPLELSSNGKGTIQVELRMFYD